jgi:hypothetical protein
MGLHVFFGCYHNLFRLMAKCGVLENLLLKEHTHTFCNNDGDVRELDFRFFLGDTKVGAPFHGESAVLCCVVLVVWCGVFCVALLWPAVCNKVGWLANECRYACQALPLVSEQHATRW